MPPIKILFNNKEIANFLTAKIDYKSKAKQIQMSHPELDKTVIWMNKGIKKYQHRLDKLLKQKYKERLIKSVSRDLKNYVQTVREFLEIEKAKDYELIHNNFDYIINKLGEKKILDLYLKSNKDGFVKSCGLSIDPKAIPIRRKNFKTYDEDCLIRNTVGNEDLLVTKVDKSFPFWFIDSGYTNFIEPNKKWHRLVRNHLHYGKYFDAPADRLGNFKSFPRPWRSDGEIIYVIEPGPFAANIFHVDLSTWKYDVEKEIRKHTDKPIKFREKVPKKTRTSLYKELLDDDYYCLISINSNAATEAIWAGVPAITLDRHISNPVTKNKISDINDLFRGNIAQWLCMLSYSQFTYEEITNGDAYQLVKTYHE